MSNESSVSVDQVYMFIIGNHNSLSNVCNILNENSDENEYYIIVDIKTPLTEIPNTDTYLKIKDKYDNINNNLYYSIRDGMEKAHMYVYSKFIDEGYNNLEWIMKLRIANKITVSCPTTKVIDEIEQNELVCQWLLENKLNESIKNMDVELITMTGNIEDILVMSIFVKS